MTRGDLHIRTMSRDELDFAVSLAADEGWNPGLNDAACFYAADPSGFLIGELDGEPIGCISGVSYGDDFAFLGFFVVKPEFRGRGYGLQLSNAALSRLSGRTLGLDGVVEEQANYASSGFKYAYRNIRFQGKGTGGSQGTVELLKAADIPFDDLLNYDSAIFGVSRSAFLRAWIAQKGAFFAGVRDAGRFQGYGLLRPCRTGYKIGPLFSDSPAVAEKILDGLLAAADKDAPVYFDVPEPNSDAVGLAKARGMTTVFETARMYKGEPPAIPLHRLFGITSFELG